MLRLDGYDVQSTKSAEECLAKVDELKDKVDVVVINGTIASDSNMALIIKIKIINPASKVLVIAERQEAVGRANGNGLWR